MEGSALSGFRSRVAAWLPGPVRRFLRRQLTSLFRTGYERWYGSFGSPSREAASRLAAARLPSVGLVIDARRAPPGSLETTLASLEEQLHRDWTAAVLLPPAGTLPSSRLASERVRGLAGGRPAEALAAVGGELVGAFPAGVRFTPHTLALAAGRLARDRDAPLVYWDEDSPLAEDRRGAAWIKPGWSRELFLGLDMLDGACLLRRQGLTIPADDGEAWSFGLALAALEAAGSREPVHLPFPLITQPLDRDSERIRRAGDRRRRVEAWLTPQAPGTSVEAVPGVPDGLRMVHPVGVPAPRVSVLVPTRDRLDLLAPCLRSLREKTTYPDLEVLVIDNGSRDPATVAYLAAEQAAGRIRVLRDDGPFNFSRLNNSAARAATGSLLCLLNNDTEVTGPGWLAELAGQASRPDVGAAGALLLYPDGSLQHAGVVLGLGHVGIAGHLLVGTDPRDAPPGGRLQLAQEVSAVTAACLVIRRDLYLEVGGMDEESLAVSFNDVDLCLRLRSRGLKVIWTPFASLLHRESASVRHDDRGVSARYQAEVDFMRRRWEAWIADDPAYSPILSLDRADGSLAWPPRVRLEDEIAAITAPPP